MNRKQLQKNILDLRYQSENQKINVILIVSTMGILAFIGTFIWYSERLFFGMAISIIIIGISLLLYIKTKRNMKKILKEMEHL